METEAQKRRRLEQERLTAQILGSITSADQALDQRNTVRDAQTAKQVQAYQQLADSRAMPQGLEAQIAKALGGGMRPQNPLTAQAPQGTGRSPMSAYSDAGQVPYGQSGWVSSPGGTNMVQAPAAPVNRERQQMALDSVEGRTGPGYKIEVSRGGRGDRPSVIGVWDDQDALVNARQKTQDARQAMNKRVNDRRVVGKMAMANPMAVSGDAAELVQAAQVARQFGIRPEAAMQFLQNQKQMKLETDARLEQARIANQADNDKISAMSSAAFVEAPLEKKRELAKANPKVYGPMWDAFKADNPEAQLPDHLRRSAVGADGQMNSAKIEAMLKDKRVSESHKAILRQLIPYEEPGTLWGEGSEALRSPGMDIPLPPAPSPPAPARQPRIQNPFTGSPAAGMGPFGMLQGIEVPEVSGASRLGPLGALQGLFGR